MGQCEGLCLFSITHGVIIPELGGRDRMTPGTWWPASVAKLKAVHSVRDIDSKDKWEVIVEDT